MMFGINIPAGEFNKLSEIARDKGFKSTEAYIKRLIDEDIRGYSGPYPKPDMTIKA